jgi:hypothetical protein
VEEVNLPLLLTGRHFWSAPATKATIPILAYRSITMAKTVIGFFAQMPEAQQVLHDLLDHGLDRDQISFITHQERSNLELGGTLAAHLIAVPGVGPVLGSGPLAASLSSTNGDPSGTSLLEVLGEYGVPADEAQWYLDAFRNGGTVIAVETGDADADRVADLMNRPV